ncbi:type II secretion system protein [Candidatus Daviesbacteria bacterium]|nr:type II secretion system protein [Candidatus Daviesbacteria bacterium]
MNISKKGFTLIEILVVMMVLSLIGVLILIIFTRTLRGSNKSQIITFIKQNGQSVLENFDKNVRNSDGVICPAITAPNPSTLVIKKGGIYIRYRFVVPAPPANPIANGRIQQDNPVKQINVQTGKEETDPEFANRICLDPMPDPVVITDTNTKTGVSVENGSFTRNRSAGFADLVTIQFDLKPGVSAREAATGSIDPVNFTTTIQLR